MSHVLVTGAASGIGQAIAREFIAAGHSMSLVDIDEPGLEETNQDGEHAHAVLDLLDPEGPVRTVWWAWHEQGPLDILVNAAGIYPSLDMLDVGAQDWDRVFALNVRSPVLSTGELARRAIEAGRAASVVNISSGAATRARPGGGPYASSKAALEMATRATALELGPWRIRVNAVSPGFVSVDSTCNPVTAEYASAVSRNPLGRPGEPADIARAVYWIASESASWITGEVLRVDGGSSTGAPDLPRLWPPRREEEQE